jgi:hypothetical protein
MLIFLLFIYLLIIFIFIFCLAYKQYSDVDPVQEASTLYLAGFQEKVAAYCSQADFSPAGIDLFFKIRELEKILDIKLEPGRRRKPRSQSTESMYKEKEKRREGKN